MLGPEPGPVGARVDPLGEALGARVFPEGFILVFPFGAVPVVDDPVPVPTVPPVPLMEEPVLPAAPVVEPPADVPLLCAKASVLDNARAPASAIVVSFMTVSFGFNDLTNNSPPSAYVPVLPVRSSPGGISWRIVTNEASHDDKRTRSVSQARKWPDFPPFFSVRRMPSMRAPRSTALIMS